ncbi:hypothetical protein [Streptomyces sp. NPDC057838]|uniref:hypothetical protein n=1 Tax=unclassified Streptomyces TaxID=2593676 RepID=UPI0036A5B487
MARRRWAAGAGLLACLLMLHLILPGPAGDGRVPVTVTAADTERPDASADRPDASPGGEAEAAGEPCPCEEDPSVRRSVARTPRPAGAAGAAAVTAGAPRADRGGSGLAAVTGRCPVPDAAVPGAVELRAFRC